MKIDYKVFTNGTAVILTRQPTLITPDEEVYIHFDGASANTAIMEIGGKTMYRPLRNSLCAISAARLTGEIKVTLADFNETEPKTWACEELLATEYDNGILIAPNDMNMPERFVELKRENEEIRMMINDLYKQLKDMNKRIEKMLEGYDLI